MTLETPRKPYLAPRLELLVAEETSGKPFYVFETAIAGGAS